MAAPDLRELVSTAGIVAVVAVTALFVAKLRSARQRAEDALARLREQASEMAVHQAEAEALAGDLEESSIKLETAMEDANQQRNAAVANEERVRLLDEAGRILASSLDYETTVSAVARLAVPKFADWAGVDVVVDGVIQQLAVAHVDPRKVEWARELNRKYPIDPASPTGVPAVIRTGHPILTATVTDEMLAESALDEDHLRMLREIGLYSVVIVPMIARDQVLGAMTLVSSDPRRHYDQSDVSLMMELARRSALAIDNARLYRAALVANESKATFLATMSHELRTPLTAIIGYQELLADAIPGPVNEMQKQQLQRIKVSAMQLLSLIDEILLFARVEAGRESVHIAPVVAKGVIDDAIAFVTPSANDRSLTIASDGVDPALMLRTDGGKLRQMLVNLIANAVKFTAKGGVTVRARQQGSTVVFEVSDTGIGITPEQLKHLFDPFWQADQQTTRQAGGSGIGLAVTKRLANLLGGDIAVESKPLSGSTFRIMLPCEPPARLTARSRNL
jgi:signal transduction histidine kinase